MEVSKERKRSRITKFFAKGDVAVYLASLLLIAVFTLCAFAVPKEKGSMFSVYYAGERVFEGSLLQDAEYVFTVENGQGMVLLREEAVFTDGYNVISVSGGKVSVCEADCPDHTCVLQGATDWGEILCLPHKMKIVAEGEGLVSDL